MSLVQIVIDAVTKKKKYVPYPGFFLFTDNDRNAPQKTFTLGFDIDDDHYLEAFVGGKKHTDTVHFNRDSTANTITFTQDIPLEERVEVKIYYK